MTDTQKLQISLFSLRLGVFIVMFMWTVDKFINPDHAAAVFSKFYLFDGLTEALAYVLGTIQLIFVLAFGVGLYKKWSYGAILIMHFISTVSSYAMYLDPWGPRNLLFFAAFPMLAAILALFLLRNEDKIFTISKKA